MYGIITKSLSGSYYNTRHQAKHDIEIYRDTWRRTWTNERYGDNNPRWREQVRRHENATTGFSALSRDLFPVDVSGSLYTQGPVANPIRVSYSMRETISSGAYPPDYATSFSTNSADIQARTKWIQKYRKLRTQFQTGVFLGELLETVRMIKSPAQALRESLNAYHRNVKKRLRRSRTDYSRVVQDSWLEYSFGVRPLISEVASACRLACADPYQVVQPIDASATMDWKVVNDRDLRQATETGWPYFYVYNSLDNKVMVRYRGAVVAENSPPSFPEQLGLSWSNLLPTVWELIPYSFLVDYFTNVGSVIDGISTGVVSLAWGCRSEVRESLSRISTELARVSLDTNPGQGRWSGNVHGAGLIGQNRYVNRQSVNVISLGIGDFQFKLPGVSTKWLNIGALADLRR